MADTQPTAPCLGASLTFHGDARRCVHVHTDPDGIAAIHERLFELDPLESLDGRRAERVPVVAVLGRTGGIASRHRFRVATGAIEGLVSLAMGLNQPTERRAAVYIAEVIWFGENPVDGRRRVAVCASLDGAVSALREDNSDRPDLVATEVNDSALGSDTARTWAVHERGAEPDDEGWMWITEEKIARGRA